jgi:hypothetical protein
VSISYTNLVINVDMQSSISVGISLPKKIMSQIDSDRGDISRSRFLLRLLEDKFPDETRQTRNVVDGTAVLSAALAYSFVPYNHAAKAQPNSSGTRGNETHANMTSSSGGSASSTRGNETHANMTSSLEG